MASVRSTSPAIISARRDPLSAHIPQGIDSNYFYGDFLLRQKRYDDARKHLLLAQHAAPRPGREVADAGRQREIAAALERIVKETR